MSLANRPFLNSYHLSISTISPVHIGCGEDYEPTNYVMADGCLHHFGLASLLDVLSQQDLQELDAINRERDPLLRLQSFFAARANQLAAASCQSRPAALGVFEKYRSSVGRAASVEQSGRKVVNAFEIARTAFNSHSQQPEIPGSSLKGAIRTAVLDALNNGNTHKPSGRDAHRVLERELLKGSFASDPMRLLKVGDARFKSDEQTLLPRIVFENNVKRFPTKDGKSSRQLLSLMREVLPEFSHDAFEAELSVQNLLGAKDKENRTPELTMSAQDIARACNRFYRAIFLREQKRLRERGCLSESWDKNASKMLELLEPFITNNQGMLLRVGKHSGAESVTLNGVRDIKILQGPGKQPKYKPEATTDWFVGEQEKSERNLLPFGWIFVDFNSPERTTDRQKLQEFMHDASAVALQRQQQLLTGVEQSRQKQQQVQAELARQAAEQQARKEAEAKAEQERQQALAAMSSEERAIANLQQRIESGEGQGQGAGCPLATDLSQLVDQAIQWQVSLQQQLFEVAKTACTHLGIDAKKNKKWRERLRSLRADG